MGTDFNNYTFTDNDGYYTFGCITNASYSVTHSSPINYTFIPPYRTVSVNNADVVEQDFVTEAYYISGKVTYSNGIGASGVGVSLTGTNSSTTAYTNTNGYYTFAVPNGSYILQPITCDLWSLCHTFTPPSRTAIVDHADVTVEDFVKQY